MKKPKFLQLLFIVFLLLSIHSANAQEKSSKDDKPAKIGVRAGWNYAAMYADGKVSGTDPLNSFYVGVFKEKKLVSILGLGSGLEYFQGGYKISGDLKRQIHYISIPLYLKVKLGPVYATGGTGFNFKVAEKLPGSQLLDPLNNEKTDFFDMPFQLGAGFKILMFSIEARYNWGLFDVTNMASNQYLQIGFTASFK